jgi:hypothetical protein
MMVRLIASLLMMVLLLSSFAFSQNQRYPNEGYRVQLFVPEGSGWQSRDVMLTFDNDRIILRAPKDDFRSEAIKYSEMNRVEYSHTKTNRKIGAGTALAANIFALPLLSRKVENHWLRINSEARETVLCLEKHNYEAVLLVFEIMLGRKVPGWDVPAAASQ